MSRNRRSARKAGADMESATVHYLAWALNDPRIERRHLTGSKDRGDVTGVMLDQERVVIECKNTARLDIPKHLDDAQKEARNDGAVFWAVAQKRARIGLKSRETVGQQLVYMTLEQYALLLNHGQPLGPDTSKNTDENEGTDDD